MSPEAIGIIGICVLLLLFLLKMPIAFAMGLVGFLGLAYLDNFRAAYYTLSMDIFEVFSSYPLSVVTAFVLMGSFAFASGMGARVYRAAYVWVGGLTGGLVMATVTACAGFSSICGSSPAAAGTMGSIALPEMKKYGYDTALATGAVAAAGSLGVLIPPSTVFIIYGILVEESIGKLFAAGILPGLVLTALFMATVFILCRRNPALAPYGPSTGWKEKFIALAGILETLILFLAVVGGLLLGMFSPTQAGGIGAAGALAIGCIRRELSWRKFIAACEGGIRMSCMIFLLITGGTIFGHFMAVTKIPFAMVDWVMAIQLPNAAIVGIVVVIFFLGGMFMDSMALLMILVPIFLPVLEHLQINLIWFGVLLVVLIECGTITPPVGVNVFVIKGIALEVPLQTIFRGILPFVAALLVMISLLIIFPGMTTFLPSLITY
ncbi:MAG: TRAP transporter large permease [Desulfobacteraceae bacterium]|nr:MAG: TRAP transporter large permease [Desulfobacteraceae bacterium]